MALENQDPLPEISLMNDSHMEKHSYMTLKELHSVLLIYLSNILKWPLSGLSTSKHMLE